MKDAQKWQDDYAAAVAAWMALDPTNNTDPDDFVYDVASPDPDNYYSSLGHIANLALAWAWWQPIEMLKLQAGLLDDFYVNEIVDTFGGNAEETNVHHVGYFNDQILDAFGQQMDQVGAALSIYPVEGLALNLSVPYIRGNLASVDPADHAYSNMIGQVQYTIENVGRASLAFRGAKGYLKESFKFDAAAQQKMEDAMMALAMSGALTDSKISDLYSDLYSGFITGIEGNNHAIYAAFYFTMIENMGVNLGLKFTLPYADKKDFSGQEVNFTYNAPFLIGLGFNYDMDALGIGARIGVGLGESWKWDTTMKAAGMTGNDLKVEGEGKGATTFAVEILPSYDIGACRIYLNAGLDMILPDEGDAEVGFYNNPYVSKVIGGGSFFAGFKLFSHPGDYTNGKFDDEGKWNKGDNKINWSVPVGIKFAF